MLARLVPACALLVACGPDHVEIADIAYDDRYSRTEMDVTIPEGSSGDGPAVLLVHGGGWHSGGRWHLDSEASRLADLGFVTANVGYRLVPSGAYPMSSRDVACAFSTFVAAADDYGFDPDRVAVMGYSAGAHLVSLFAVAPEVDATKPDCAAGAASVRPRAVISGAGPQDMLLFPNSPVLEDYLGGRKGPRRDTWIEASPIAHVDAGDPAFLFVHGSGDLFVGLEHSENMRRALRNVGVTARLIDIPGGGHLNNPGPGGGEPEFGTSTWTPEAFIVIADFLRDELGAP